MKNSALTLLILMLASTGAFAATYHVDDDGNCPGSGTSSNPFCSIDSCNSELGPGDTCLVADGTYAAIIHPEQDGTAVDRLNYLCPGQDCTVTPTSAYLVNLIDRSHVTLDGFRFQGFGAMLVLTGPSSVGNTVTRIRASEASVITDGGSGTVIENFDLSHSSNAACVVQIGVGYQDQGTILRDGSIRGGGKNLAVNRCSDCVLDGLKLSGAWSHSLELNGASDLLMKNSAMMASGLNGAMGPYVKQAHNLTLLNNAFVRGWKFPAPGYGCGLTGTVSIRNNIFNNGGKRVDSTSADQMQTGNCPGTPNWPPTYDVDFNAYVGAGNFVDDFMTGIDDRAAFWRDYRNPLNVVRYFPDSNPGFDDWQDDLDCDRNSVLVDNVDYRPASSDNAEAGPLWGPTAPFWGAPVRCSVDPQRFETNLRWKDALALGDRIEFSNDGIMREITAVTTGSGDPYNGCEYRITFSPPLAATPQVGRWFLAYPAGTESPGKRFEPQAGSPVIDAGDPNACGHATVGGRCDIGPVEFGAAGNGVPVPLTVGVGSDKNLVTWEPIAGAQSYHVYRGLISGLKDSDGDGYPDSGFGVCQDSADVLHTDTTFTDESAVPTGDGFFYLMTFESAAGEEGLGTMSSRLPRIMPVGAACP